MNAIVTYLQEALEELHHVRRATRNQALRLSAIVIGFCFASAAVFGLVDFGLAEVLRVLLSLTY